MKPSHSNPRLREDLVWCPHGSKGLDRWTIQDPLNGEFYYFTSLERDVLRLFRGDKSLSEIYQELIRVKPGFDWNLEKLTAFLKLLSGHNLVLWDQYGKGLALASQVTARRRQARYGWLTQPLSIRIPLFKPVPLLQTLRPIAVVLFHPLTMLFVLIVALTAILMTAIRWSEVSASLPPIELLMRGDRIVLLLLILAVVKSLHELGHALACHRYTGQCGEIGMMLLVFTPCMYCDVSASWKLRSRWQRAMVALAGVYVELFLAAIAILSLAFVSSEVVRAIALYVFVICSLGTILLNGNPLIKYDGYYALSDLLEIPNLAQQAREATISQLLNWFTHHPPLGTPLDASKAFLITYWSLATAYRICLTALVLWGVNMFLRPLGLEFVAYYIAWVAIIGIVGHSMVSLSRVPRILNESGGARIPHTLIALAVLAGVIGFLFFVPLADGVEARALVRFRDMQPVYVQQPGTLIFAIGSEREVREGETIYELNSPEQIIRELEASFDVQETQQKILFRKEIAALSPTFDLQLPTFERIFESKQKQLEAIREEGQELIFRAPESCYWFHALTSYTKTQDSLPLLPWTDFPLENQNIGAYLEKGVLLGWLTKRDTPIFEAYVSERDMDRIRVGTRTNVRVEHQVERTFNGSIVAIGRDPISFLPEELAGDWFIMAQPDSQNRWIPENPMFRVLVSVDDPPQDLVLGGKATVQMESEPITFSRQLFRLLKQTVFYQRQKE